MSLYSLKASNIRKSWIFVFGFFLLIAGVGYVFAYLAENIIVFYVAAGIALLYSLFTFLISSRIVLSLTKSRPLDKQDHPELYRLTENLCIAAGLPMPKIYIINSAQPNAFVTGKKPKDSILVVTTALLDKLERVELEGVIAHELSHIGNRDVLLGTMVVALMGGIILLSDIFIRISFSGGRRRDNGVLIIVGIAVYIISFVLAKMMQMAVSRQREFLADASAALLTRYPEGLARALEKISQDDSQMPKIDHSTAHLYICSPFRGRERRSFMTRLFSTHPPIEDRIKRLRDLKI